MISLGSPNWNARAWWSESPPMSGSTRWLWITPASIAVPFANGTAIEAGVIHNHRVDPDIGGLSDHHALAFQLGEPREIIQDLPSAKLNWKNADEEEFLKALKQEIEQAGPAHTDMVSKTLNVVGGISVRCKTCLQVPDSRVRAWSQ